MKKKFKKQVVEEIEAREQSPEGIEIEENEDGSVDINLDPQAAAPEGGDEHYANLAEFLPDDVLGKLASDLNSKYTWIMFASRKDWEKTYTTRFRFIRF